MIKLMSKCVLVAAVAAVAMAGTTTMSHAAKKKAKAKAAPVATCMAPKYTTATCANGFCRMQWCGLDGKWYPSLLVCAEPFCPKG